MRLLNVRIEPWQEADFPLLVRLNAPEMMEHLGGPETEDQTAARHRRYVETAKSDTAFVFKIVLDPGEQAAGQVTFWERTWHDENVYEMGWGVLPEYQGQGIATRAADLALARARETGRQRFLHAFPSVDNAASNALCRKLGFVLVGETDVEYPPGHMMRCNDWRIGLTAPSPGTEPAR
jgi:RimJ/RimL family protein N-acetyltransferase